jgi:hypothetical protein
MSDTGALTSLVGAVAAFAVSGWVMVRLMARRMGSGLSAGQGSVGGAFTGRRKRPHWKDLRARSIRRHMTAW